MLVTVQDTFNTMHKIKVSLWHLPEDDIRGTSNMMWWVRVSFANNAKGGPNMHKNIRMLNYYWNISEYSNASNVSNVSGYSNIQTEAFIRWSLSCFENSKLLKGAHWSGKGVKTGQCFCMNLFCLRHFDTLSSPQQI